MASLQLFHRNRLRVLSSENDNQCVNCVFGLKNCACVSGQISLNPSPLIAGSMDLTSKSQTVNSHVNSCVVNADSVIGLPQKKGVIPNYCQNYTEIICVKDVSCVGHLSSVNLVTNVPTAALDFPVGTRLHQFWEKWAALAASPKVVTVLREGYSLPFWFRPNLTRSPTVISNYVNPHKNLHLLEALYQLVNKNAVERVATQKSLGFYNRLFLVPKPNSRWRPILDLSTLNTFLNRVVQNGDTRDNKNLPTGRGVGYLHRFQGRILPHNNSQSVQEVHAFSHPGSVLPVQSPTLWPVHTTHGVHSGGQRGQTDGFTVGYKNPPVPRRLVGESHIPPNLSPAYTDLGSFLSRTRLAGEQGEVKT